MGGCIALSDSRLRASLVCSTHSEGSIHGASSALVSTRPSKWNAWSIHSFTDICADKSDFLQMYRSPGMDIKWCRLQHHVLLTYIRYVLQSWGPVDDPSLSYWMGDTATPWGSRSLTKATPELKRVLMRARILREECCLKMPAHKSILWTIDWSREFVDIVKEIQWCTSVAHNRIIRSNAAGESDPDKNFPWQANIGFHERVLLEKAERDDLLEIRLLIEHEFRRPSHNRNKRVHECSFENCGVLDGERRVFCLQRQVLDRERKDYLEGSTNHMWRFDPEAVKYVQPLGGGSFGAVTEVTWLGFKFAQKKFYAGRLDSLQAEAEVLVKLKHPHIVKVFAYSEDSLLMERMSTDLCQFMSRRMRGGARVYPFSLPAAMDLMLQIADAMSYIHSQNVAHRDLKSPNILVNPMNTPGLSDEDDGFVLAKIADFGLAKVKREVTRYSQLTHDIGTRKWMAPEIFAANIEDDHLEQAFPMKADVYSFGMVCFEILSGEVPFKDELPRTLYSKLTAQIPLRPQLPSSCPADLASLICACWDADPQKRPTFGVVCQKLRLFKAIKAFKALTTSALNDMVLLKSYLTFQK